MVSPSSNGVKLLASTISSLYLNGLFHHRKVHFYNRGVQLLVALHLEYLKWALPSLAWVCPLSRVGILVKSRKPLVSDVRVRISADCIGFCVDTETVSMVSDAQKKKGSHNLTANLFR